MRYGFRVFLRPFAMLAVTVMFSALPGFASGPYQIGSANTVTADPAVPRPSTKPCLVQLFKDVAFENFTPYEFQYTPPAACPGPWQKVVFVADISVTAGIQYDRTANFWLGSTNIYFGTTAEPSPTLSPSWHVETDETDYSPLFTTAQTGQADIGNLVNGTYTGIIYASAALEFYPIESTLPPPQPFNQVLPMSSTPGTATLNTGTDTLSQTFDSLPMNIERAYLDVYAQSQSNDEFWYTCVPNDLTTELDSCGNTAFREGEITIDGQPAGVAPIYPWIFTGGIDPYLWFPLPGVQTLNFRPYRVNLTPFAGLLSNGQPHTVALSVYNADSYFSATATLLLKQDESVAQVSGAITQNTLTPPNPQVQENIKTGTNGQITGTVSVNSDRTFTISGYITTGKGQITTTVNQTVNFSNVQAYNITSTQYIVDLTQNTDITSTTTQTDAAGTSSIVEQVNYPLNLSLSQLPTSSGGFSQTTTIRQEDYTQKTGQVNGVQTYSYVSDNTVAPTDVLEFDSSGNFLGNEDQASSQTFSIYNSNGVCYDVLLTAANNVLTGATNECTETSASAK